MGVYTYTAGEKNTAALMNAYAVNGGLVYVTSTTVGSAVSSVTVSNCFSSTYDNYRITFVGGNASVGSNLNMTINGSTGSTYLTTGYFMTPGTATMNAYAPAATTVWVAGPQNTTRQAIVIDIFQPFATQQTFGRTSGLGTTSFYDFGLADTNSASSTGFTFSPASGTLTGGTITVYGYRKA